MKRQIYIYNILSLREKMRYRMGMKMDTNLVGKVCWEHTKKHSPNIEDIFQTSNKHAKSFLMASK